MPSPTIKLQQEQLKELRKLGASFNSLSSFLVKSERGRSRLAEENALEAERLKKITSISTPDGGTRPAGTGGGLGLGSLGLLAGAGGLAYLFRDEIGNAIKGLLGLEGDEGLFPYLKQKFKEEIDQMEILSDEGTNFGSLLTGVLGSMGLSYLAIDKIQKSNKKLNKDLDDKAKAAKEGEKESKKNKGKIMGFLRKGGILGVAITALDAIVEYQKSEATTMDAKLRNAQIAVGNSITKSVEATYNSIVSLVNFGLKKAGVDFQLDKADSEQTPLTTDAEEKKRLERVRVNTNQTYGEGFVDPDGSLTTTGDSKGFSGLVKDIKRLGNFIYDKILFPGGPGGPTPDIDSDLAVAGLPEKMTPNYDLSNLVNYVKGKEGFQAESFYDYGQYSQGYGLKSTRGAAPVTEEIATERLLEELANVRGQVIEMTTKGGYNFNDAEIDALTSFAYNLGVGKKGQTGGLANLLFGDKGNVKRTKAQIAEKMLQYNKAGGKVLSGLTERRIQESEAFRLGGLFDVSNLTDRQRESTSEALQDFAYQNSNLNYVKADDNRIITNNNFNGGNGGSDNNSSPDGSDRDNRDLYFYP